LASSEVVVPNRIKPDTLALLPIFILGGCSAQRHGPQPKPSPRALPAAAAALRIKLSMSI
jgi:hypothetical protein